MNFVHFGGVAQLGEHLPCKQGVRSSILLISTNQEARGRKPLGLFDVREATRSAEHPKKTEDRTKDFNIVITECRATKRPETGNWRAEST